MRVFQGLPKETKEEPETLSDLIKNDDEVEQPTLPLMIRRSARKGKQSVMPNKNLTIIAEAEESKDASPEDQLILHKRPVTTLNVNKHGVQEVTESSENESCSESSEPSNKSSESGSETSQWEDVD